MSRLTTQLTVSVGGLRGPGLTGADTAALQQYVSDAESSSASAGESAGVATAQAGIATGAAEALSDTLDILVGPGEGIFQLTDEAGYRYFVITPSAIRHPVIDALVSTVVGVSAGTGNITSLDGPVPGIQATDEQGYRWLKITPDEFRHPVIDALAAGGNEAIDLAVLADVAHFLICGQSLALALYSVPVLSTVAQGHALRAAGGVRPGDTPDWSALVPLIETVQASAGETVASGCAMMIRQMVLADTGVDLATLSRRQLYSAAGKYDTALADLSAGTVPFTQLTALMTGGRAASNAASKTYAPQMMLFLQGERDYFAGTSRDEYLSLMKGLRSATEAAARTASGIADLKLPMVTYQTATHLYYGRAYPGIALAQLDACDDALIGFAAPTYFLQFVADNLHLAAAGEQWLGAYFGLAIYRWLVKREKPAPFVPDRTQVIGSTLLVSFPVAKGRKLVADTTTVGAQANLGFQIFAADGSAITINAARIIDERTVALDCAAAPAAGARLTYAFAGTAAAGRGNVRDNAGDTLKFDPTGFNRPMHTWAPIFERIL